MLKLIIDPPAGVAVNFQQTDRQRSLQLSYLHNFYLCAAGFLQQTQTLSETHLCPYIQIHILVTVDSSDQNRTWTVSFVTLEQLFNQFDSFKHLVNMAVITGNENSLCDTYKTLIDQ